MKKYLIFALLILVSIKLISKELKIQNRSVFNKTNSTFPQPFNELNNSHNAPAISTGYYFIDNHENIKEDLKPLQRFRDMTDNTTGIWTRIYSGPRQVAKSYWINNPNIGLSFFRNPSLPIENKGDFFALGNTFAQDTTDDAIAGPIPFNLNKEFYFNGIRYDSIYVSTNGIIALTNRRYHYNEFGVRTIPQGENTTYDKNSSEYYSNNISNYLGRDYRNRIGNGNNDQTRDDFGYVYSVLGGDTPNPSYTQTTDWDTLAPNPLGGIRARGGEINSGALFNINHKAAIIAPMFADLMLSQWNTKTKKKEDYGQVYYNISEDKNLFTIYVKNAQSVRNWKLPNGTTLNIEKDLRPGDENYLSLDYQVQLNVIDSSITIVYDNIKGNIRVGNKVFTAKEIFELNGTIGVRGFARHNNYNRTETGTEEYEQFTYYSTKSIEDKNNYPDNSLSIKFKQWKNVLRVADIRYKVRKAEKNANLDFTEIVPSNKIENYEILAGEPKIGAIQPVALIQNLSNDIQGINGTNYIAQELTFQARFRIINEATGRIVYNRLVPVDNTCLSLVDEPVNNREICTGDPEVKVRLANVTFSNNTFSVTYPNYPSTNNHNGKTQNGVPVYGFAEVSFPSWEPNEFARDEKDKLINIGSMKVVAMSIPNRPGGPKLGEEWTLDDTLTYKIYVLRRLESMNEDFNTFSVIDGKASPDVTKWVNIGANVVDGDEVSRHPLAPRGKYEADNEEKFVLNSPALLMNRKKLDGSDWSSGQNDLNGDELISFPIEMSKRKGSVISFGLQRTKKQESYDREFGDAVLFGPEPRTILNGDEFTPFAAVQAASYVPDAITLEFALPSEDGLNNILNIPEERWRNHPRRGGAMPETRRPALEVFGGGGYQVGFLETDKDSALAPYNININAKNGLRANIYDDGIDFEFKKYYVEIPDTFINYKNEGAKNFRFRLKIRASNDQKSNVQIPDDDDDFVIDNIGILYKSIEARDIEVTSVKVINPYTQLPATQATNIPVRVTLYNNANTSGSYILQVRIYKDYKDGDERMGQICPVYCRLETINTHPQGIKLEYTMPPFNASRSGGGKYRVYAFVNVPNGDLNERNDTTYTDFEVKLGDSFAYDRVDNPTNEVNPQTSAGLRLQGYAYGGVGSNDGSWSNYPAIQIGQGDLGGSTSGQFAMKFILDKIDTLFGYKAYFGSQNSSMDGISFSLYGDQSGQLPNGIAIAGTTILRERGRDDIRSKNGDLFFNEYVDYRLDTGVVLQPGTYWMAIAQLGQTGIELGATKYRMGMRTTSINIPAPFENVLVGNSGTQLIINKELRSTKNDSINNNLFAFENTKGSGLWSEMIPTTGNPGYAHSHHFGVSNVDNQTLTLTRSTWVPMIRPYFGNKSLEEKDYYTSCPENLSDNKVYCITPGLNLRKFDGKLINKIVELEWGVNTEINNKGFNIEKREVNDTIFSEWQNIKFVEGAGYSIEKTIYNTIDSNIFNKKTYQYRLIQIDFNGKQDTSYIITIVVDFESSINENDRKNKNIITIYPNPVSDNTTFEFSLYETAPVRLEVMDLLGNVVAVVINETMTAGNYQKEWNGKDINNTNLQNGNYIYKLTAGNKTVTSKLTIMR